MLTSRKSWWSIHIAAGCKYMHTLARLARCSRERTKDRIWQSFGPRRNISEARYLIDTTATLADWRFVFAIGLAFPFARGVLLLSPFSSFSLGVPYTRLGRSRSRLIASPACSLPEAFKAPALERGGPVLSTAISRKPLCGPPLGSPSFPL